MYIADTVKPNDKTETIPVHELLCLSQYLSIISSLLLQGGGGGGGGGEKGANTSFNGSNNTGREIVCCHIQ